MTPRRFWGLEKIHPFDSNKFRRIVQLLQTEGLVQPRQAWHNSDSLQPVVFIASLQFDCYRERYRERNVPNAIGIALALFDTLAWMRHRFCQMPTRDFNQLDVRSWCGRWRRRRRCCWTSTRKTTWTSCMAAPERHVRLDTAWHMQPQHLRRCLQHHILCSRDCNRSAGSNESRSSKTLESMF